MAIATYMVIEFYVNLISINLICVGKSFEICSSFSLREALASYMHEQTCNGANINNIS